MTGYSPASTDDHDGHGLHNRSNAGHASSANNNSTANNGHASPFEIETSSSSALSITSGNDHASNLEDGCGGVGTITSNTACASKEDPHQYAHQNGHDTMAELEASSHMELVDPHAADLGGDIRSAVLGIIKAMVGPAILYLPHGFVAAGYLVALPIMAVSTVMYLHSSKCLLETWKWESEKQLLPQTDSTDDEEDDAIESPPLDEPRVVPSRVQAPKPTYPELAYRAFGSRGETLVKVGIALMQSGVCLTYLIFVPHNLHSSLFTITGWDIPTSFFLFVMLCIQIPLSWIRDIRRFTPTNALANTFILYGLIVCLCFAFGLATAPYDPSNNSKHVHPKHKTTNLTAVSLMEDDVVDRGPAGNLWEHFDHLDPLGDHWILFIGTSVLLFEGSITLLLPLQEAVQPPSPEDPHNTDRERFPSVYPRVIILIQCFYVLFAISCWMSFGDGVHVVLTTSLPPGFFSTTVQLAYSVAVLFTFPLQNYPALEIACGSIASSLQESPVGHLIPAILLQRNSISAVLVCLLGVVAVTTMDSLDKVVSLTGAMIGIPIAFMIPPLIHSQLVPNISPKRLKQNYAVAALGSVAMVVASLTTIWQWNDD